MLPFGEYVIDSESSDNKYTIKVRKQGKGASVTCTCPGFRYRRYCKHVTSVRNGEYVA